MAQVGNLIQDQNLNVHFNGASAGGKANVSKAQKKGAVSGRKPLGDLSNSVKPPAPHQSLKKQNSKITSPSKITFDGGSKKKILNKAPEKQQTGGRKALTDISNSSKQQLHEAPKKNVNTKVRVVAEDDLNAIAEEGFLHNHEECIKAQTKAMDLDEFLEIVGLNNGFFKKSVSSSEIDQPLFGKLKPANPPTPRYMELEELPDPHLEDPSPWKHEAFSDLDSPPGSPESFNHSMLSRSDNEDVNFMLIQSP